VPSPCAAHGARPQGWRLTAGAAQGLRRAARAGWLPARLRACGGVRGGQASQPPPQSQRHARPRGSTRPGPQPPALACALDPAAEPTAAAPVPLQSAASSTASESLASGATRRTATRSVSAPSQPAGWPGLQGGAAAGPGPCRARPLTAAAGPGRGALGQGRHGCAACARGSPDPCVANARAGCKSSGCKAGWAACKTAGARQKPSRGAGALAGAARRGLQCRGKSLGQPPFACSYISLVTVSRQQRIGRSCCGTRCRLPCHSFLQLPRCTRYLSRQHHKSLATARPASAKGWC
jgi:hypothetical protein